MQYSGASARPACVACPAYHDRGNGYEAHKRLTIDGVLSR